MCPWVAYESDLFPSCEELLCSWIRQPINTWSNLGYFLIGLWLIYSGKKSNRLSEVAIGVATLGVGTSSFLGHASKILFFGMFDFGSIFLLTSIFLGLNLKRVGILASIKNSIWLASSVFIITMIVLISWWPTRVSLFVFHIAALLCVEFYFLRKSTNLVGEFKSLRHVLVCFFVGAICLILDTSKFFCNPQNHYFQLHAVWHLCSAFSIYLFTLHLRRTKVEL